MNYFQTRIVNNKKYYKTIQEKGRISIKCTLCDRIVLYSNMSNHIKSNIHNRNIQLMNGELPIVKTKKVNHQILLKGPKIITFD